MKTICLIVIQMNESRGKSILHEIHPHGNLIPWLPKRWEDAPCELVCFFAEETEVKRTWRAWDQSPQRSSCQSGSLWLPYGALCFNSAEVERESGRVGGAFGALWEGPAAGGGGVWRVIDRWRGGVYSTSIGRMGAGAASSLKIANALLFPPRNSQESYLWIKRGCETSQRWTLHNNDRK